MARKLASEDVDSDSSSERKEPNEDGGDSDVAGGLLNRRDYVKLSAATAGAVLGASGLTSAAEERGDIQFDRVVDAVDDLGMDPTGNVSIDGALNDAHETGTLIEFPPGEYRIETEAVISGSTSRWGIRGTGDSHEDVTFRFPNADNSYWFVHQHGGEDVLLDNFTLDTDDKLIAIRIRTNDGGLIRDVEWSGYLPERDGWPGQLLDPGCRDTDGVNRVVRTVMGRDGSFIHGHSWATGRTGITGIRFYPHSDAHGDRHAGETILEDIEMHQLSSNGVRSTHPTGVVTVRGGFFKNCHLAHLRIHAGDHPTKQSSVTGTTMVIDHDDHLPMGDGEWNEHGCNAVMLDSTSKSYSQAIYEDCDIICRNVEPTDGWGLIRCNNSGSSSPGGGAFRNCRITNDTELQTIWIDEREDNVDAPRHWLFENCEITVTASDQYREAAFVLRDDWDGSVIRNCVIHAPNGDVDGVFIENCDDVTIEDTTIDVSGRATVFENADVTTTNVSHAVSEGTDSTGDDEGGFEEDPSLLRVIADEDADAFEYSFTVDGRVEHIVDGDYPSNPDASAPDTIHENDDGSYTVEGVVAGYTGDSTRWGGDSYRFTGDFSAFSLNGVAAVTIDGETVDPARLVSGSDDETSDGTGDDTTSDDGSENILRVIADEDADAFEYSFTVDGRVEHIVDGDYPSNPDASAPDTIRENDDGSYTVEGVVAGYTGDSTRWGGDSYRFTGELIEFSKAGPAEVVVNGDVIDPDEYTIQESRTLRVIADEDADAFEYSFTVDGRVEHIVDGDYPSNPDVSAPDTIRENDDGSYTVEGVVAGYTGDSTRWGGDSYRITGAIVSMRLQGQADVLLEGEVVDPDDYGLPNRLTIIGSGSTSTYDFTVDGELRKDPNGSLDGELEMSGSSAEGSVVNGVDSFRFEGDITHFQFEGEAGVYLDDQQVEPTLLQTEEDPTLQSWIVVEGVGHVTEYAFSVSGHVRKSPDLGPVETDDVIKGNAIEGVADTETDGYRFSGDLESLEIRGTADLRFNEN
ncbi:hypothetical protein [Halorubrum kocurii]|uniref:hypothetical protein n=1 Tax=Halorubrum kocurii TaxID=478441 RepID=UPI00126795D5|nr:hypothetical protein [Halorubrum kocurii]